MDVVVGFSDKASRGLKNITGQFNKTSKSISGKITGLVSKFGLLGGVGGVAGVGLAISKSISTFSSFEKAIANAASVTGATGEVFENTKKHIASVSKELGETTVFSASHAANAFYDLASAGYDVASMTKDDLQPIMDLAAATQTGLTKTTEVVTSTLGQFGLGIESSSRIADVFAKTIGSSKATVEALELSLKYVGPVAKSMGMGIEEVNAVLGNLYNAGFKGEQAGTALRGAFARLLNPTGASVEALAELGLTLEDVDPTTRDFADILDTLTAAGIDTNSAMKLFGVEAAPAMLALTDNTDGIRELEASLLDAGGTAETMAENQLATFSGSITLLKSALEGIAITIGGAVAPYLKLLAEFITAAIPPIKKLAGRIKDALMPAFIVVSAVINTLIDNIKRMIGWFKEHEDITVFIGVMAAVAAAVIIIPPLLAAIGTAAITLAATVSIAGSGIIAAIAPISLPIIAIGAAIALLAVAWRNNWGDIQGKADTALAVIKGAINFFIDSIKTAISVFLDIITLNWSGAWDTMSAFIAEWGPRIVNAVKIIGTAIITALVDGIRGALGTVYDIITGETSVTSTIIGGLKSLLPGAKAEGAAVSETVADGIEEKNPTVAAAADSVTDAIDTELQKALAPANETGLSTTLNMAAGIESGTSAVSAAAKAVVDAAKIEMGRLSAIQASEKRAAQKIQDKAAEGFEGGISGVLVEAITAGGATMRELQTTSAKRSDAIRRTKHVSSFGDEISDWIHTLPEQFYIQEDVWSGLSADVQDILRDRILGILAAGAKTTTSEYAGERDGKALYTAGIAERSILGTLAEYEAGGAAIDLLRLQALLADAEDRVSYVQGSTSQKHLLPAAIELMNSIRDQIAALPSYAKGGYISRDQTANIHAGEYVIPKRGVPVVSGGKDINITYHIGDIIGIDNLQSILGQHDQKLLQKLQSLI